ncbi:hypothetical protein A2U01_0110695, partial [Trifolium medium]|nr:hypothetical protein [Trifolium medium]
RAPGAVLDVAGRGGGDMVASRRQESSVLVFHSVV